MQLQEIQHIFLIALNRAKLRLHEYQTRFCPKIIVLLKVQHWWCGVKTPSQLGHFASFTSM